MLSQYCEECVKYIRGHCAGKEGGVRTTIYFGQALKTKPSFLKFCSKYEFDLKLWKLKSNNSSIEAVESITQSAKERKQERVIAKHDRVATAEAIDIADVIDSSEQLSSSDFDDLLV